MKKVIPFKKSLTFDTNVSEITSISLENSLGVVDGMVSGDLVINGSYKITDSSIKTDEFEFRIPIDIDVDDRYLIDNVVIDIDDFYYEIINNNILEVNIDIMLDNLCEKVVVKNDEVKEFIFEDVSKRCIEEEKSIEQEESIEEKVVDKESLSKEVVNNIVNVDNSSINSLNESNTNIFSSFTSESEEYSTYYVYIVREGDSIETIMMRYKVSKEILSEYNDISELKLGDKLIIPVSYA